MKFTILQQDLISALSSVSRSCGVRSQLPVLGNILLQTDHGKLKLVATNLEIGVIKYINTEISEEGEITVPAKTLVEVVANLGGEKIEFSATSDNLEISTPTFSSSLSGIPATEFPSIPLSGKEMAVVDPLVLMKSLPQVAFSAASDDGRPVLTGILTEIKGGNLQLVATDGYRLAYRSIQIKNNASLKVLIPRRTFEEVVRLINEDEVDRVSISTSDEQNQVVFKFGSTQVSSRLIEGNFPAWEKIIPTQAIARAVIERSEILKGVKLAAVFTRSEANIVTLQSLPHKLILTSQAKELGSQKKEIEAETEGQELSIAFNTRFLIDVLSALSSTQVMIELSGNLSAALIKPVGEEGWQYIIMPVNQS